MSKDERAATKTETPVTQFHSVPSFETTEYGVASIFWAERRPDFRFVYEEGRWIIWNGKVWARDTTGIARRTIAEYVGGRIGDDIIEANQRAATVEGDDRSSREAKVRHFEGIINTLRHWHGWIHSERGIRDALRLVASMPGITVHESELDANGFVLSLENGTLDLIGCKLRPHDRGDLITKMLPFEFDPKARAPRFDRFLGVVQPDRSNREFLQRAAGRSLVRNVERRQLIVLYGSGANGKTVFLSAVGAVVAPFFVTADVGTLLEKKFDRIENDLARMASARMVVVRELPEGRRFDESMIKALTGGDRITARFLRQEYFEYDPGFLIWIATNAHPLLSDSPAMTDRVVVVPWLMRIEPADQDRGLLAHLLKERAGILNWALEGLKAWRMQGLTPPPSIANYTTEVGEESLPFTRFIADCVEEIAPNPGRYVPASWIYAAYVEWARRLGQQHVYDQRWVGRKLGEAGFVGKMFGHNNTRGFANYAIKPEWTAAMEAGLGRLKIGYNEVDALAGSIAIAPAEKKAPTTEEDSDAAML